MKKLIIIILVMWSQIATAEVLKDTTVLPAATTIRQFSTMPTGQYQFFISMDTIVDLTKDTALIVTKIVTIHDTVKLPCPPVDSVAIKALKICPPQPKQRTVIGISLDLMTNKKLITYSDGTQTTL